MNYNDCSRFSICLHRILYSIYMWERAIAHIRRKSLTMDSPGRRLALYATGCGIGRVLHCKFQILSTNALSHLTGWCEHSMHWCISCDFCSLENDWYLWERCIHQTRETPWVLWGMWSRWDNMCVLQLFHWMVLANTRNAWQTNGLFWRTNARPWRELTILGIDRVKLTLFTLVGN